MAECKKKSERTELFDTIIALNLSLSAVKDFYKPGHLIYTDS